MTVEDWAKREARKIHPNLPDYRVGFQHGVGYFADALLSDEAVEAAEAEQYKHRRDLASAGECACGEPFPLTRNGIRAHDVHVARAALQAAIEAVTKEDGNE